MLKRLLRYPIRQFHRIENRFLRFLFVGVINTAFGYLMFLFFLWIGLHYSLSLLFSQILGVLFNYKTTGYLVFENKSNKLVLRFFLVYVAIYFINLLELYLLNLSGLYPYLLSQDWISFVHDLPIDQSKLSNAIGQAIVILPNAIIGFLLNRAFVFRENQ